ncbi:MAG: SH3 domain-containing protein [Verrucomicrobia bacterium]|nr:SH3 domain-containing protein [Verrucomicrobiota bacterium]
MQFRISALLAAACLSIHAQTNNMVEAEVHTQTNEVLKVKVTGDRVSLRAKPDINSELLDRAMRGEELVLLGKTNDWVAVQAPDSLNFWVSGEYIQNGIVVPEKLNIRSGPSQNYSVVFVANKGDSVALRGEFNEWIKIAPPAGSRVWISEKYTETIEPPKPEPVAVAPEPKPEPVVETPEPKIPELTEEERKPLLLVLDKNKEQGVYDEIPGVLRRANPGLYKLVLIVGDLEEPICLVRGNEDQMKRYLNRALLIKGKKYWAKDVALPVLKVEKIHLDPILED